MVSARTGFTLAEVIVAMTLLSVLMLSVAATGIMAAAMLTRAELREQALREADAVLDSLLAAPPGGAGARTLRAAELSWTADAAEVVMRISFPDGALLTLRSSR